MASCTSLLQPKSKQGPWPRVEMAMCTTADTASHADNWQLSIVWHVYVVLVPRPASAPSTPATLQSTILCHSVSMSCWHDVSSSHHVALVQRLRSFLGSSDRMPWPALQCTDAQVVANTHDNCVVCKRSVPTQMIRIGVSIFH